MNVSVSIIKKWNEANDLASKYLEFGDWDTLAEYNDAMMILALEESISGIKIERSEAQKKASFHFIHFKGFLEKMGYQI